MHAATNQTAELSRVRPVMKYGLLIVNIDVSSSLILRGQTSRRNVGCQRRTITRPLAQKRPPGIFRAQDKPRH